MRIVGDSTKYCRDYADSAKGKKPAKSRAPSRGMELKVTHANNTHLCMPAAQSGNPPPSVNDEELENADSMKEKIPAMTRAPSQSRTGSQISSGTGRIPVSERAKEQPLAKVAGIPVVPSRPRHTNHHAKYFRYHSTKDVFEAVGWQRGQMRSGFHPDCVTEYLNLPVANNDDGYEIPPMPDFRFWVPREDFEADAYPNGLDPKDRPVEGPVHVNHPSYLREDSPPHHQDESLHDAPAWVPRSKTPADTLRMTQYHHKSRPVHTVSQPEHVASHASRPRGSFLVPRTSLMRSGFYSHAGRLPPSARSIHSSNTDSDVPYDRPSHMRPMAAQSIAGP